MIAIAASSLTLVGLIGITSDSAVVLTVMVLVVAIGKFATYALAIHFMVSNSLSIAGKQQLSTASQVIGYSLAFGGPVVVGLIYENSNSWNPGLLMLAGITLVQTYFGFVACKRD
jgi:CP family cyanate transporter-like MFS transporter